GKLTGLLRHLQNVKVRPIWQPACINDIGDCRTVCPSLSSKCVFAQTSQVIIIARCEEISHLPNACRLAMDHPTCPEGACSLAGLEAIIACSQVSTDRSRLHCDNSLVSSFCTQIVI